MEKQLGSEGWKVKMACCNFRAVLVSVRQGLFVRMLCKLRYPRLLQCVESGLSWPTVD